MKTLRIASAATSAADLAACEVATLEIARELGRRAAREDFERGKPERQSIAVPAQTGAQRWDVQNCCVDALRP